MTDNTDNNQNESPIQFPCEFPIKVVGKANDEFEIFALGTIRKHFPDLKEDSLRIRKSAESHYMAITVNVIATSKEQLDALYQELSGTKLVIMAL
jgi:putative lipoic acid-binding regulatory protein